MTRQNGLSMAALLLLILAGTSHSAPDPTLAVTENPTPFWSGPTQLQLNSAVPVTWSVYATARFGGTSFTWSVVGADDTSPSAGTSLVDLTIPREAHMHDLASEYVTDLSVRIFGHNEAGTLVVVLRAPPAYLTWPDGPDGPALILSATDLAREAPGGVLSSAVRSSYGDIGNGVRIMPPLTVDGEPVPEADLELDDGVAR